MVTFIICADGPSFIICALAIAATILHLSTQFGRAVKLAEKRIASQATAQPPENTFNPHSTTEDDTPAPPTRPALDPWKDYTKEDPEPARKHSFSSSIHTLGKRMSMPRSKSLSFLWGSHRKSSMDDPSPLPPLLRATSHSPEMPVLTKPANTEDDPERAEPPISDTPASSATIVETRSAAEDDCLLELEHAAEPPSIQMALAPSTLSAPAAMTPAAPMSTPTTTTSSSTSSTSAPSQPRARTAPRGPRPRPASMSALGVDGRRRYARPACPENSLPGEMFETRFENPFKPRSRSLNIKREKGAADDTPRRRSIFVVFSSLRQSLIKHTRGGSGSENPSSPTAASDPPSSASSRRTSVSSATGTTLSLGSGSGSTKSKSKWSFCVRNGAPRTDPYGPPHFAQVPTSSSEGRQGRRRTQRA